MSTQQHGPEGKPIHTEVQGSTHCRVDAYSTHTHRGLRWQQCSSSSSSPSSPLTFCKYSTKESKQNPTHSPLQFGHHQPCVLRQPDGAGQGMHAATSMAHVGPLHAHHHKAPASHMLGSASPVITVQFNQTDQVQSPIDRQMRPCSPQKQPCSPQQAPEQPCSSQQAPEPCSPQQEP